MRLEYYPIVISKSLTNLCKSGEKVSVVSSSRCFAVLHCFVHTNVLGRVMMKELALWADVACCIVVMYGPAAGLYVCLFAACVRRILLR